MLLLARDFISRINILAIDGNAGRLLARQFLPFQRLAELRFYLRLLCFQRTDSLFVAVASDEDFYSDPMILNARGRIDGKSGSVEAAERIPMYLFGLVMRKVDLLP